MFDIKDPVSIDRVKSYDEELIYTVLKERMRLLCPLFEKLFGKKVMIKPNLVRKMKPEEAATTHPSILVPLIKLLKEQGAEVVIAESPAGVYSEGTLKSIYRVCGIDEAAERGGAILNFDTTSGSLSAPKGESTKVFNVITPVLQADLMIDLCVLKSHGLTTMSAACKNLFGLIPGVQKIEMHARFTEQIPFCNMILDLDEAVSDHVPMFCICDAIIGMEGNGPTGGTPREIGYILTGINPATVDLAAEHILGMDGKVEMLQEARRRGFCPQKFEELSIVGDADLVPMTDFVMPESKTSMLTFALTFGGGRFKRLFEPKPLIDKKKCIGCGECHRSCPQKTIVMVPKKKGGRVARINDKDCIKCYCCQELCPHGAVKIHKNFILKIVDGIH